VAQQGEAAAGAVGRGEVPTGAAGRGAAGAAGRAWEEEEPREKRDGDRRAAVHAGARSGQRVGLAVPGPAGIRRARSSGPRVPGESPSRAWSTDLTGTGWTSSRLLLGSCKLGRVRREAFATSPLCHGRMHGRIRQHCCHALLRPVPASRWRSATPTGMSRGVEVGCQQTCLNGWCGGHPARTYTVAGDRQPLNSHVARLGSLGRSEFTPAPAVRLVLGSWHVRRFLSYRFTTCRDRLPGHRSALHGRKPNRVTSASRTAYRQDRRGLARNLRARPPRSRQKVAQKVLVEG
jgi:hypothetical protein